MNNLVVDQTLSTRLLGISPSTVTMGVDGDPYEEGDGIMKLACSSYFGPLSQCALCGHYCIYLATSGKFPPTCSIPLCVCSGVDILHSLMPMWILREGFNHPVHWCLDTLHWHSMRYTDRPGGGMLSGNTNRITSCFY